MSKYEKIIYEILEKYHVHFEFQKTFDDCKYKRILPFDFYLSDLNTIIEFDGKQHFTESFSSAENIDIAEKSLKETKIRDKIKNDYCKKNNITLVRISYKETKNIQNIIEEILKRSTTIETSN